jgi:hypothetical protein
MLGLKANQSLQSLAGGGWLFYFAPDFAPEQSM